MILQRYGRCLAGEISYFAVRAAADMGMMAGCSEVQSLCERHFAIARTFPGVMMFVDAEMRFSSQYGDSCRPFWGLMFGAGEKM